MNELTVRNMYDRAHRAYDSTHPRRMFIHKSMSGNGGLGAVFFAMAGTPPKDYALYVPELHYLLIIDVWGKSRRYSEIRLAGLDDMPGDVTYYPEKAKD